MNTIAIKYKYGKTAWHCSENKCTIGSAAAISQVLDKIQPEMQRIGGMYNWTLDGYTGQYVVKAQWKKQCWTESTGKTPFEALLKCWVAQCALRNMGILH